MASRALFQRIGIASSLPTIAIGTIGHAGAHGDLDEAAAAEAAELVAVAHQLAGGLGALGEHEHELLVVVEEAVRVVGVRGHAAGARPQRAEDRAASGRGSRPGRRPGAAARSRCRASRPARPTGWRRRGWRPGARRRRAARARAPPTRRAASSGTRGRRACGRARAPASLRPQRVDPSDGRRRRDRRRATGTATGIGGAIGVGADEAQRLLGRCGHPQR